MPHIHLALHTLLDVHPAALCYSDCSEIFAALKRAFADRPQRAGELDLFDTTVAEAVLPDELHAARNFDASQTLALLERPGLEPPQRGREANALYRASSEDLSFPPASLHALLSAQSLQALVQLHLLQLTAEAECAGADLPHARREDYLLEATLVKALSADRLESIREPDSLEVFAPFEGAVLDLLQRGRQCNALERAPLEHATLRFPVICVLVRPEHLEPRAELRALETIALRKRGLCDNPERPRKRDVLEPALAERLEAYPFEAP